jgi:mRNA interferase RelE/StbE
VANFSVEIRKSAAKELAALPAKDCARVVATLATQPRPFGSEKVAGDEKFRIRQGAYRILYEVDDRASRVTIVKIAQRPEATNART